MALFSLGKPSTTRQHFLPSVASHKGRYDCVPIFALLATLGVFTPPPPCFPKGHLGVFRSLFQRAPISNVVQVRVNPERLVRPMAKVGYQGASQTLSLRRGFLCSVRGWNSARTWLSSCAAGSLVACGVGIHNTGRTNSFMSWRPMKGVRLTSGWLPAETKIAL